MQRRHSSKFRSVDLRKNCEVGLLVVVLQQYSTIQQQSVVLPDKSCATKDRKYHSWSSRRVVQATATEVPNLQARRQYKQVPNLQARRQYKQEASAVQYSILYHCRSSALNVLQASVYSTVFYTVGACQSNTSTSSTSLDLVSCDSIKCLSASSQVYSLFASSV